VERTIIHLNVADFAVAVERLLDRRLRCRPLIIAAGGVPRAAVYDMSEEAFAAGVRKAMPLGQARRLCPEATVLPPRTARYEQAMAALVRRALAYSPLVEPGQGDGHLFADVTGTSRLFGPAVDVAWRLGREIRRDMGLDPIWSVGPSKLIAKVATRLVKPRGECIVGAGEEEAFLAPLSLGLIPGLERCDLAGLRSFNLTRAGQVHPLSLAQLEVPFGRRAGFIFETVRGVDPSPVLPVEESPPVVKAAREFGTDSNAVRTIEGALYALAEQAGSELRRRRLAARRVTVRLDYSDGRRRTGRSAATAATADDDILFVLALGALQRAWQRRVRVRCLALCCDRLTFPPAQLPLFADERGAETRRRRLMDVLDRIRGRFGAESIRVGRTLAAA